MAEIVQLAQEANRRSMIEDRRWEGALILGPAVIAPLENVRINNSSFDAVPDILFLELPEDRAVVGFIGLRNVTFEDCQFQNVGVAGTPETITQFKTAFTGSDTQTPPPGDSEDASKGGGSSGPA